LGEYLDSLRVTKVLDHTAKHPNVLSGLLPPRPGVENSDSGHRDTEWINLDIVIVPSRNKPEHVFFYSITAGDDG
jgi:hypothetical protein